MLPARYRIGLFLTVVVVVVVVVVDRSLGEPVPASAAGIVSYLVFTGFRHWLMAFRGRGPSRDERRR